MTLADSANDRAYLIYLRRLLVQRFSASELRTLCFDLGVDAESIAEGATKPDLARGLVKYLEHRHRLLDLVAYIRDVRDDINLATSLPASPMGSLTTGGDTAPMSPGAEAAILEPQIAWSYDLPGQPMAAPLTLGTTVLLAFQESSRSAQGGVLQALELATGAILWGHRFENAVIQGLAPFAETRAVVSLTSLGRLPGGSALVAVDDRGQILWRTEFETNQISAPAACPSAVAVTGNGREVILLDADTGREMLATGLVVDVAQAAPACDENNVYVPCCAPSLLAIDYEGDLCWRFDVEGVLSGVQLDQTPLLVSGSDVPNMIIVGLSVGSVLAIDRDEGTLLWETQVGPRGKRLTPPVCDGRRIYVGARDGVYAVNLKDGTHQWSFRIGSYVSAPPVVAGDVLCIAGTDRRLHGVDRRTGELLWQHRTAQEIKTSPSLAEGDENGPYAVFADCTGGVTAITYPVPAVTHEAAGRWRKAAQAWQVEGDLRRAAAAWERYAMGFKDQEDVIDEQAQAWVEAARLYAASGTPDKAAEARQHYAEVLGLPLITVEVQHGGLVLGAWSRLQLVIRNQGYGLAKNLVIRVAGDRFEGQIAETQTLAALPAGRDRQQELDVKPLEHGDSVPLRVQISYLDQNGEPHRREETIHLAVAQEAAQRTPGILQIPSETGLLANWARQPALEPTVDIEIRVGRDRKGYTVELTLNGTQVFSGGHMDPSVVDFVPTGDLVQDGRYLFDALLRDGAVRKGWHVARGQAETINARRCVRLRIDDSAVELHQLPWELLYDDGTMIGAAEATPFSRYLPVQKPWGQPITARPLRVLGVVSSPRDLLARYNLPPLDVEMEKYLLASAFSEIDPHQIRLTFLKPPVTLERLSRAMMDGYHWLHFVGHGRLNVRQQRVDLLMEDAQGTTRAIADHLFCRMLAHRGVRPHLVFLSVCQSAGSPVGEILTGLAPKLVEVGVPAVVAMRDRVRMRVAQKVARVFYEALASHGMVDRAMNQARDALLADEQSDIAAPVLYMRLGSGRLWDVD
ncbi:MAG: PQQ-binding-like beta-propeller repeat protein [Anaerolineae bacterium]